MDAGAVLWDAASDTVRPLTVPGRPDLQVVAEDLNEAGDWIGHAFDAATGLENAVIEADGGVTVLAGVSGRGIGFDGRIFLMDSLGQSQVLRAGTVLRTLAAENGSLSGSPNALGRDPVAKAADWPSTMKTGSMRIDPKAMCEAERRRPAPAGCAPAPARGTIAR
jgi:hypothetical protein